ncbi:MAG: restriction endonuclease [Crenarchaeota archaeon]|nr:MAG: restriction endonuclease [Thermoproteota archaeon]
MDIPDFETIMAPLLNTVKDGKEYAMTDIENKLIQHFDLSEEERNQLKPSSSHETIFQNRMRWARFYLKKAGLLEDPRRGHTKITSQGIEVAKTNPQRIDIKFLMQFQPFVEFYSKKKSPEIERPMVQYGENFAGYTPEDLIIEGYQELRANLQKELLDRLENNSPQFFERLVLELIRKMGYGIDHKVLGRTGDGGIDGVIKEDKLGLDEIYFEAKRWKNTVPIHQVRDFGGALLGKKSKKGIFITTSDFSSDAYEYVKTPDAKIVLINGDQLTQYMIDYDVGVQTAETYSLKKIDEDYFES